MAVVTAAANTSTGTQNFTVSGFGTPIAAMFVVSRATSGSEAAHAAICVGFTDGTRNRVVCMQSEDGGTRTDSDSSTSSSQCVRILDAGATSIDGEADWNAWVTDGVQIDWTNAPASAYLVTVILFGGSMSQAYTNHVDLTNTFPTTVDVTAPGFRPNLVIAACCDAEGIDSSGTAGKLSLGFVHDDNGTVTQMSYCHQERNNQGTSANGNGKRTDMGIHAVAFDGTYDWGGSFNTFDANGFSVTANNAAMNSTAMIYLAIDTGTTVEVKIQEEVTPGSTGTQGYTGYGWVPDGVMFCLTYLTASGNDTDAGVEAAGFSFGAMDNTDEAAQAFRSRDNVGTPDTGSFANQSAIPLAILEEDGVGAHVTGVYTSMDSDGYTINYLTSVPSSPVYFIACAISETQAAPAGSKGQIIGSVGGIIGG
jgi:hypothetical protein